MLFRVVLVGWCWVAAVLAPGRAQAADPVISEFMAANRTTLRDDDGAFSDWIELHNRAATAVSLNGWFLTDTAANLTRWRLPAVTLQPGEYFVVFASGKHRTNATAVLHTNFSLDRGGEYLALVRPDGVTVASEFAPAYPPQQDDVSYGRETTTLEAEGHFARPTPGAANAAAGPGFAPAVAFSAASQAFTAPFALELSAAHPAAGASAPWAQYRAIAALSGMRSRTGAGGRRRTSARTDPGNALTCSRRRARIALRSLSLACTRAPFRWVAGPPWVVTWKSSDASTSGGRHVHRPAMRTL
ncbi:MAG TPA: lamin tail domain-containing protein [Verrucomicrobiota bacterium]|nr:lamin tail domain-containing protein [Verrucomicrobiota bacterium]